ncbi:MAG: sigma-54 dependent transcriptional regulator [Pirellulales bacterium]
MAKLLVVDDEPSIVWALTRLGRELGHEVVAASSAEQALGTVDSAGPDVILLDVRLPGMSGLDAMARFRERCPHVPLLIMTAYGDLPTAVAAVRNGAFEYLVKPFDLSKVQRAWERALASREPPPVRPREEAVGGLIGRSPPMQEVFKRIALAAGADISVLIRGESGVGKELAARAIHQHSARAAGPFVAVNVASLSSSLAESELFGHVRGSFTGADRDRVGLLVQATGGTLFLDEVAEIPLATQVKLLRVLEHGEVLPVGGQTPIRTDFRIVTATHQDLPALVAQGLFRHDLYFRLAAFEIEIPALRERGDDLVALAESFLDRASVKGARRAVFSAAALHEIRRRPWYGNVRELRNAVEHAAMLARGGVIEAEHLPPPSSVQPSSRGTTGRDLTQQLVHDVRQWTEEQLSGGEPQEDLYGAFLRTVEPAFLDVVMERHRRQCATAARTLGIHRTTLRKKLDEHSLVGE